MKSNIQAGNVNLKGKKSLLAGCGCCDFVDLRDREIRKWHEKEMRDGRN